MAKERNYNPVQAQRKADKAKAIKKGKADVASQRNERLAKKNPDRIRQQIEDLKAITSGGGKLTRHEEQVLEGLEKELKAVIKAREALGDKAPSFDHGPPRRDGQRSGPGGVLGKRRRDQDDRSSDSDVPEDVRNIPMPRDTPPPIPKEIMDKWHAKRRERWARRQEKLAAEREGEEGQDEEQKPKKRPQPVVVESKAVYEAKPAVRDLRKEAVSAFVPTAVRMKIEKVKGNSGLLEPEEAEQLEREGYLKSSTGGAGTATTQPADAADLELASRPHHVSVEEVDDDEED